MSRRVPEEALTLLDDRTMAHEGKAFTGTAVETYPDGRLRSEVSYLDGLQHGTGKTWSPSGNLMAEFPYQNGAPHGVRRELHENGRPSLEEMYEFGIATARKRWGAGGELTEEFVLSPTSATFSLLVELRSRAKRG